MKEPKKLSLIQKHTKFIKKFSREQRKLMKEIIGKKNKMNFQETIVTQRSGKDKITLKPFQRTSALINTNIKHVVGPISSSK